MGMWARSGMLRDIRPNFLATFYSNISLRDQQGTLWKPQLSTQEAMPSIPQSQLTAREVGPQENKYGRVELSPMTVAFLVPVFILFIFGPL